MNGIVKEKWLKALRSKQFKQGQNRLRTDDTFCCLGVLCELAVIDGVISKAKPQLPIIDGKLIPYLYGEEQTYLPQAVQQWAGLKRTPHLDGQDLDDAINSQGLGALNDSGMTFEAIADLIETHTPAEA